MLQETNILIDLIFILLHFLLFMFNYNITNKKLYQPAVLFSLIWLFILLLHLFFRFTILDELSPLNVETYLIFFTGAVCFSVGSFIVILYNHVHNNETESKLNIQTSEIKISLLLRILFIIIIVVGLPFYIEAAINLFIASESENFFQGVRYEMSYGDMDLGPLKYLLSFSFVVFAVSLYAYIREKNTVNLIIFIIALLVAITYAIFATGRSLIFIILTLYIGISFLYSKGSSIKKYAWLVILFFPLFMIYGIFYGKGGDTESSFKENLRGTTEGVAIYLATPLNAFDVELKKNHEINYTGDNTLRFFIKVGQQFDILSNRKIKELAQEFIFVPYATNVYTYYSPYINDFGLLYALIMLVFYGALHTWLCNRAIIRRTLRYSIYYSFLLYPLVITFFTDQYLSLLSSWIQTVIFIELVLFLNKFFVKIN